MIEFFQALNDPSMGFLRYAFVIGIVASVSFGIVGSYVVVRRITYIAGAIAHCVLGGIGAALYLRHARGLDWAHPLVGALIAALLAALIIGTVGILAHEREDTVIGALWAIGMAVGLMFLHKTPGGVSPMSFLFGNILLVDAVDLWLVIALDVLVVAVGILAYHKLSAVCFDAEFASVRGLRVNLWYLVLLCLTALSVVLLVRVVGIVMVIALLTLPAAIGGAFVKKLWQMMLLAIFCCALFTSTGLMVSYSAELPGGPTIICIAGAVYLLVMIIRRFTVAKDA